MKLALTLLALLALLVLSFVASLARHGHIDTAGQGVLLLDGTQSAECSAGGGCAAFSIREIQVLLAHGFKVGAASCGKGV